MAENLDRSSLAAKKARDAYNEGRYQDAVVTCNEILNDDFNDHYLWHVAGMAMRRSEKWWLANQCLRRAVEIEPNNPLYWLQLGLTTAWADWGFEDAKRCFYKALDLDPGNVDVLINMLLVHVNMGEYREAMVWAEKAGWGAETELHIEDIAYNRGMAELALGNFKDGWRDYCCSFKHRIKREFTYQDEARWDGNPTDTLVVFGEQGLGDEIMFSSILPDAVKQCRRVILDCDSKIAGLMRRSYLEVKVHGTRHVIDGVKWIDGETITARCGLADLGKFFRPSVGSFPRTKFLTADPERCNAVRGLLNGLGERPKIGVSWKGGCGNTFRSRRSFRLIEWADLLRLDADFIDLSYEDHSEEREQVQRELGVKVHHWPWLTLTMDYDDTAALVSELDFIVTVTTTIVHTASGLGKPVHVLVPSRPTWRYLTEGEDIPWYGPGTRMSRQIGTNWEPALTETFGRVERFIEDRKEDSWAFAS